MAIWSRVQALVFGGAVATAASDGARPVLEPVRQHAWKRNQLRVLDPEAAARLRAQGLVSTDAAEEEASRNGIGPNRLHALVALLQAAPERGALDRMLNRKTIDRDNFNEALAKHQIPPKWWPALYDLTHEKLDPVQLANAIHRGLIDDPGLLAVPPPTGTGNVPAYPTYDIPALEEAAAAGLDRDRLGVLVGLTGLPMGPHEAANAVFRHILTDTDFQRAIAEGNTRNEWGEAIFEQSRQIPTARDFLENALRGYRSLRDAIRGASLHGMSEEHATMIYQNQGRPMPVRLITQALARGGKFEPEPGELTDPYMASIVEGNLKPAYYDFARALRYTMPSVFAIRQLAESHVWDEDRVRTRLLWLGWLPEDAADVAKAWTTGTATAADPHAAKAQTQLWNTTHTSYKGGEIDEAMAAAALPHAGVDAAAIPGVIAIWQVERGLIRATLSAADIRKAYRKQVVNESTGAAWTKPEAIAALQEIGWDAATASQYLDIG